MNEWKDITAVTLEPGKAYEIKVVNSDFHQVCLYVSEGCFVYHDPMKEGGLGCIKRDTALINQYWLPFGEYVVDHSANCPLPIPAQVIRVDDGIEPGCIMIKELE